MASHKAAVLETTGSSLVLKTLPIPEAITGSAIIKVLAVQISPLSEGVLAGSLGTPLVTPTTPSAAAIGRVHAVGPDAVSLKPGQLVFYDFCVAARDDPNKTVLQGYIGFDADLDAVWSHGTYAEYARVPLERCWALNEDLLFSTLGYTLPDLVFLGTLTISVGAIMGIEVQPGDTVIVAPATGYFGGAAVHAAIAFGARVIAAARNEEVLSKIEACFKSTGRITTVKLTGEVETDTKALVKATGSGRGVDKYIDFSPPQAAGSKHIESCLLALRPFGRAAFVGGIQQNVGIPYWPIMTRSLRIQGQFMFNSAQGEQTIKLVEAGLLKLGEGDCSGVKTHTFKLDDIHESMKYAAEVKGWGHQVALLP